MRITQHSLFYWILNRCRGLQLLLLAVILISLFFRVYPLEMQKRIINIAINLKKLDLLYLYCGLYFGAVLIAGLLKYLINMLQTIIGQKILIELRQELYSHVLQLPLQFFRKTQAGTVVSAMTAELNTIGFFLGGALAIPVTSILTFFTFLGFMIALNPTLGLLSMAIYPIEFIVIPMLQRHYNRLNGERVQNTRAMANLVNESISGIHEVHGNASFHLEGTKLNDYIYKLYKLLNRLFLFKYGIKFSNNLFQSFGPFLLFLVGGYFAIHGEFTIGALIAFLSAYEKVYDPWKEMIEYYQSLQDAQIRYKQIMETFDLEPEYLISPTDREPLTLAGNLTAQQMEYVLDNGVRLLDQISFHLEAGKHLALVGFSGSGKSTLSLLISQLYAYSGGSMQIDGHEVEKMSKLDIASNIGFVSQHPFLFTGTVKENLLYSRQALSLESGVDLITSLERKELLDMVRTVGLEEDVVNWGLMSTIDNERAFPLVQKFLAMRRILQQELHDDFKNAVEFYNHEAFLHYSPLSVNIIFGDYNDGNTTMDLVQNKSFRSFLKESTLETNLLDLGREIAVATVEILGNIEPDEFFFNGNPMDPTDFPYYRELVVNLQGRKTDQEQQVVEDRLLALALDFVPGRHQIIEMPLPLQDKILKARHAFLQDVIQTDIEACTTPGETSLVFMPMVEEGNKEFTPYCISQYLPTHTLLNNILFGSVIDRDLLQTDLGETALAYFKQEGLLDDIMEIGLDFHVGSKGDRLSGGQRQKVAIARTLLKHPPIIIFDEATASLDNASQARIQHYIDTQLKDNTTVIAVVHRLDMISGYDHIMVLRAGQLVESGSYDDLIEQKGVLYALINEH